MFAQKLSLNIDISSLSSCNYTNEKEYTKLQKYAKNLDAPKAALKSLHFDGTESLIDQLPKSLTDAEKPNVFFLEAPAVDEDYAIIPAHVDYRRTCGINIYIEANNETTEFFKWDQDTSVLTTIHAFIAKQNECWLINTSVPHGVLLKKNKKRKILTFSFSNLSYEEVLKHVYKQ